MKRLIAMLVVSASMSLAHANFIDVHTNLEWLDLNNTRNVTYLDIINGVGNTWIADGWTHASGAQVNNLFFTYMPSLQMSVPTDSDYMPGDFYAYWQPDLNNEAQQLATSLGNILGPFGWLGVFDRETPNPGGHNAAGIISGSIQSGQPDDFVFAHMDGGIGDDNSSSGFGHLLVREAAPIPIPAAFWLFGSALGLLGWVRRNPTH